VKVRLICRAADPLVCGLHHLAALSARRYRLGVVPKIRVNCSRTFDVEAYNLEEALGDGNLGTIIERIGGSLSSGKCGDGDARAQ
jgi:hypothetical protein